MKVIPSITGALCANSHPGSYTGQDAFNNMLPVYRNEMEGTDMEESNGRKYVLRRLTPTECARLQGAADWWCQGLETDNPSEDDIAFWTDVFEVYRQTVAKTKRPKTRNQIVKWLKNPYRESAEYRMWGNAVAVPCAWFVLAGIAWAEQSET